MFNVDEVVADIPETEPKVVSQSIAFTRSQKDFIDRCIETLGSESAAETMRRAIIAGLTAAMDKKQRPKK